MQFPEFKKVTTDPCIVVDKDSAVSFVLWCVETIGLGYHPDNLFEDYIDSDGEQVFDASTASKLNDLQNDAFAWCDPYAIGAAEFEKLLGRGQTGNSSE